MWLWDRHKVDDWRDRWTTAAAGKLNRIAIDQGAWSDAAVSKAGRYDVFVSPAGFISRTVAPQVRAVAEPVVLELMTKANDELQDIVDHRAVWYDRAGEEPRAGPWDGFADVARAAAPLAGGMAVAAALPFAAVTTASAGFLGLATVTTISWPIVAIGGAAAGTGIATGMINAAQLHDRFAARLRAKARAHIVRTLLNGTTKAPSLLQQIAVCLREAGEQAKTR